MKIVQINVVYSNGSTGKLVKSLHSYLSKENGIESFVMYGRGSTIKEKRVYKFCGELEAFVYAALNRISGLYYGSAWFSTNRLIRRIRKIKPDVVNIHCINGHCINIPKLISFLAKSNIKTVITLHAEFLYTANCGHALGCNKWINGCYKCPRLKQETKSLLLDRTKKSWNLFKKAFDLFDKNNISVVSVSPWLMERACKSQILKNFNHLCIYNGIDTDIYYLKKNVVIDKKQVLFVTPFFTTMESDIKGGYHLVNIASKLPEFTFLVVGDYEKNMAIPTNIKCLGKITDQRKIAGLYSKCLVTLILSKKETFSLVTVESLCCGTPVVGFKCGAPEMIAQKEFAYFFEQGDVAPIIDLLGKIDVSFELKEEICEKSRKLYSDKMMGKRYFDLYGEFIKQ